MRVELVASGFSRTSGVGIERYSWELFSRLRENGIGVRAVSSNPPRKRYALAMFAAVKVPIGTFRGLRNSAIVHATDPSSALSLPLTGRASVVTFHDIMPLVLENYYGLGDRLFSRLAYQLSRACTAIIAVSLQTRDEIVRYLDVPEEKIHVIPLGVSEAFAASEAFRKEEETVGYVGDINPRKRLDFLFEGFAILKKERPNAKLLIIGKNVAEYLDAELQRLLGLVDKLGIRQDVVFTGRVDEMRLIEYYNRMKLFVLPSEYEGFGLPILEAERCGTPVIVREDARIPSEVSSSCLRARTPSDLAQIISDVIADPREYRRRVERGIEHSAQFSWDGCVKGTMNVYKMLMEGKAVK